MIGTAVKRSQLGGTKLPLAQLIVRVLNSTGERLRRLGCDDFSAVLTSAKQVALDAFDAASASSSTAAGAASVAVAPSIASIARELLAAKPALARDPAGLIVAILAHTFDAFRDVSIYQAPLPPTAAEEAAAEEEDGGGEDAAAATASASAAASSWVLRPLAFLANAQAAVLDVARILGGRGTTTGGGDDDDGVVRGWDRVDCSSLRLGSAVGPVRFFLDHGLVRPSPALLQKQQQPSRKSSQQETTGAVADATAAAAGGGGGGGGGVGSGGVGSGGGGSKDDEGAAEVAQTPRRELLLQPESLAANVVRAACVLVFARVAEAASVQQSELQFYICLLYTSPSPRDRG